MVLWIMPSVMNKMSMNWGFWVLIIFFSLNLYVGCMDVLYVQFLASYTLYFVFYSICMLYLNKNQFFKKGRIFTFLRDFVAITTSSQTFNLSLLILSCIHPFIEQVCIDSIPTLSSRHLSKARNKRIVHCLPWSLHSIGDKQFLKIKYICKLNF